MDRDSETDHDEVTEVTQEQPGTRRGYLFTLPLFVFGGWSWIPFLWIPGLLGEVFGIRPYQVLLDLVMLQRVPVLPLVIFAMISAGFLWWLLHSAAEVVQLEMLAGRRLSFRRIFPLTLNWWAIQIAGFLALGVICYLLYFILFHFSYLFRPDPELIVEMNDVFMVSLLLHLYLSAIWSGFCADFVLPSLEREKSIAGLWKAGIGMLRLLRTRVMVLFLIRLGMTVLTALMYRYLIWGVLVSWMKYHYHSVKVFSSLMDLVRDPVTLIPEMLLVIGIVLVSGVLVTQPMYLLYRQLYMYLLNKDSVEETVEDVDDLCL